MWFFTDVRGKWEGLEADYEVTVCSGVALHQDKVLGGWCDFCPVNLTTVG